MSSYPCTLSAWHPLKAQLKVKSIQETVTETVRWSAAQSMVLSKAGISFNDKPQPQCLQPGLSFAALSEPAPSSALLRERCRGTPGASAPL